MTKARIPYKVETRIIAEPKKKRTQSIYLSWAEKVEVMNVCGDAALILLEFYVSKVGTPKYEYSDKKSARALGWTIHKVKKVRLRLQKAEYLCLNVISDYTKKMRMDSIYVGKDAVLKFKESK